MNRPVDRAFCLFQEAGGFLLTSSILGELAQEDPSGSSSVSSSLGTWDPDLDDLLSLPIFTHVHSITNLRSDDSHEDGHPRRTDNLEGIRLSSTDEEETSSSSEAVSDRRMLRSSRGSCPERERDTRWPAQKPSGRSPALHRIPRGAGSQPAPRSRGRSNRGDPPRKGA